MSVVPPPIQSPVLTLDVLPGHIRAVLFTPGAHEEGLFRLVSPMDMPLAPAAPDDGKLSVPPPFTKIFWQSLLAAAGQPKAAHIVACGAGWYAPAEREAFFRHSIPAFNGPGGTLRWLGAGEAPGEILRLSKIQRILQFPFTDAFCASVLGVLADAAVWGRSFREGIAVSYIGHGLAQAALIFQGRLLAVAERNFSCQEDAPGFLEQLESFRLGWLPQEQMRALGGFSVVEPDLPAEAEGFRPMYITGPQAHWLHGHGIEVSCEDTACRGLLHGCILARPADEKVM